MNTKDVDEVMKDMTGSPVRYMVLGVGILLLIFSSGMTTWKRTAERDASGAVEKVELEMGELELEKADAKNSEEKNSIEKKIDELRKEDLKEARLEAQAEKVDSMNGNWFLGMIGVLGQVVACLGLLLIAVTGSNYERLGSLIALGFVLTRLG